VVNVRVGTGQLRRAGTDVRRAATKASPDPATNYQDGLSFLDAGGSAALNAAVIGFADGWRSALADMAGLSDQVGVLAGAAADRYEASERAAAEVFGAAGDGLAAAGGGRA
jgi:Excreted virulence factor EspC, type VII ESX diderm